MSKDLFNIWMDVFVPICLEADEHDFLYYPVKQDVHDVYSHEIRSISVIWEKNCAEFKIVQISKH